MAEDDDGVEAFEVNDRDLEYALNPGGRRHFHQSKEQATYGIWADSDEEEDGGGRGRGGFQVSGDRRKATKNYAAPVNFVSGGIKQGSSLTEEKESDQPKSDEPVTVNAFSLPAKRPRVERKGANVFAGMRTSAVSATVDANQFASFTKHGKGDVIMKMMKSMGYKLGEGLGKEGQGIVEPVQAAVRPGRAAVGAYGKESTGVKFGESAADAQKRAADESRGGKGRGEDDEEEEGGGRGKSVQPLPKGSWRKATRVKTQYRTMDDVIKEGGSLGHRTAQHSGVKVIDMTGPEQRVYSGYDALAMKSLHSSEDAHKQAASFDVPELTHNLNLLIDLTEEDIRRTNHQLKTIEDQNTALNYDLRLVRDELQKEEADFARMQEVYGLLERLNESGGTMEEFKSAFQHLKTDFSVEFELFELDKVAVPAVLPMIKELFRSWSPLETTEVAHGLAEMKEWREILEQPAERRNLFSAVESTSNGGGLGYSTVNDRLCAFDRLMWDGWMPALRSAVLQWDPRDQMENMLCVVETWFPLMAPWMREKVIEQLLIPRLTSRVEEWDPLQDARPINNWLVPWLEILGDHLLPVFFPVRQKLAKALRLWCDITDKSAIGVLRPWKDVWTPGTMAGFLGQNIVPKLKRALVEMNVDPDRDAKYEVFFSTLKWLEMISPDVIAEALSVSFFPKWYDTLCYWLDSPGCVLSEVKEWLTLWNNRFPQVLMQHPAVKEHLRRGLLALAGQRPARAHTNPLQAPPPPPPPPPPTMPGAAVSAAQLSLKDVLEITAARQNITYVPQQNRLKEGKQVYWFGTVSIYMDRGVVYALDTTTFEWLPVSLDRLLAMA